MAASLRNSKKKQAAAAKVRNKTAGGKLIEAERVQRNIQKGLPARAGLPWADQEISDLAALHEAGSSVEGLSVHFQRTPRAVAIQLERMGRISAKEWEYKACKSINGALIDAQGEKESRERG
jgi:hypothetical protein